MLFNLGKYARCNTGVRIHCQHIAGNNLGKEAEPGLQAPECWRPLNHCDQYTHHSSSIPSQAMECEMTNVRVMMQ